MSPKIKILDNRFRITKKLGSGGMAKVYLAYDLEEKREVALKILPPSNSENAESVNRFKREFEVCSKLDHENIIKLYSCGQTSDKKSWYYTMEVLKCRDLKRIIKKRGKLKEASVFKIAIQLARGFIHYHEKGVVHRDLKPANLMIEPSGRLIIMDFGLVRDPSMTQLTKTGTLMGTPKYMSPELLSGVKTDPRSDLFQLGSILHECLCGKPAFSGKSFPELGRKILMGEYTPVRTIDPSVSQDWENFLLNCLETDRHLRYQDANHVLKDLKNMKKGLGVARFGEPLPKEEDRTNSETCSSAKKISTCSSAEKTSTCGKARISAAEPKQTSPFSLTGTDGKKVTSKRGKVLAISFFSIVLLCSLLLFIKTTGSQTAQIPIKSLTVFGGKRGALLLWKGTKKLTSPRILLTKQSGDDAGKSMTGKFTATSPSIVKTTSNGSTQYAHSLIISELENDADFSISLVTGSDNEGTLPRTFSTRGGMPQQSLELRKNGDAHIVYQSKAPFSCSVKGTSLTLTGKTIDSQKLYYFQTRLICPLKTILENAPLSYRITTIDGDIFTVSQKPQKILGESFESVHRLFLDSRKVTDDGVSIKTPFFTMWEGEKKPNFIFSNYGAEYFKANDLPTKSAVVEEFWDTVQLKLENEAPWYQELLPLLPGLPALIKSTFPEKKDDDSLLLRHQIAFALIGLEIMQGTAISYRIPGNKVWDPLTAIEKRPFPCTGTSMLRSIDTELTASLAYPGFGKRKVPIYFLKDLSVPVTFKNLANSPIAGFHREQPFTVKLPKNPLMYSRAEVALDMRTSGNPSMVMVLNINNHRFLASLRTTKTNFEGLRDAWTERVDYDGVVMAAFAKDEPVRTNKTSQVSLAYERKIALDTFENKMISYDKAFPDMEGASIYHQVPLTALQKGDNSIKVTIFSGPSSGYEHLVYKSIRILLSN